MTSVPTAINIAAQHSSRARPSTAGYRGGTKVQPASRQTQKQASLNCKATLAQEHTLAAAPYFTPATTTLHSTTHQTKFLLSTHLRNNSTLSTPHHAPEAAACDDLLVQSKQVESHAVEHCVRKLGPVDVAPPPVAQEGNQVRHEGLLSHLTDGGPPTVVWGDGL